MNHGNQVKRQLIFSRVLVALLIMALAFGMTPLLPKATAYADDVTNGTALETEKPEIVVTGTGIISGGAYTADNITNEVAYTIEDLKALAAKDSTVTPEKQYVYSALNTYETRSVYSEKGLKISTLLKGSNVTNLGQKITFTANDGAAVTFDPAKTTFGTQADKVAASISQSLDKERYFYPNAAKETDQEAGKEPVEAVLSWAEGGGKGETTIPPSEPKELGYVKVAVGQLGLADYNNPLFNKYVNGVYVGEEVTTSVIKIDGKEYSREEMLLKERADREYTSTNNAGVTKTEYTRGVPMSELLKAHGKQDIVHFKAADGYDVEAEGKTVQELIKDNCILAYASGTNKTDLKGIYTSKNDKTGYFTLFGDTIKQGKMISEITVERKQPPVTLEAPTAKATAGVNSASISWSKSENAQGYELLQASNPSDEYTSVKNLTATTLKATVTKLTAEEPYYFKVRAYKINGGTATYADSKAIKVTPKLGTTTLKVKAGSKKATLSWKKVTDATGYKVYRATSKNGKYPAVKTITNGKTVSYTNTGLKKGKTYYFKVRAYKKVGSSEKCGGYSAVKSVKVK